MNPKSQTSVFQAILIFVSGALIIFGVGLMAVNSRNNAEEVVQEDGDSSPVPTALPTITPTPVPTLIPSPSPTASLLPIKEFPASAEEMVKAFMQAFQSANRTKMETYFAPDSTNENVSLRSRLFNGVDNNGLPGGPTLFDTSSASQKVVSFEILEKKVGGTKLEIIVRETRTDIQSGETLSPQQTKLVLVPKDTEQKAWLIESYTRVAGTTGKYDALVNP